jgi:hypothetical protein
VTRLVRCLALCLLMACARAPREQVDHVPSPAAAWLNELAQAHARADASDSLQARRVLEDARARPVPSDVRPEDRRQLLQDLQFRLGSLALAANDPARTAVEAQRGLELGQREDTFTTNLLILQGRAAAAQARPEQAAAAYASALAIHERLLDRALEGNP